MNRRPILYIGLAAPLVEVAQVWTAKVPACTDSRALREKLQAFPDREIGAYGLSLSEDRSILAFRTGLRTNPKRIAATVQEWSGQAPEPLSQHFAPVDSLDHRRALIELQACLQDQPVQLFPRIGLTLQQLQQDLAHLQPELVLLSCHGVAEGFLLFEDGRSGADFVPGERLFPLLRPSLRVLFLDACHSEAVLKRAGEQGEQEGTAIVYVDAKTPIEVPAGVAFQSMFIPALLRGEPAGEAFDAAQQYVANDPDLGDFSVGTEETPPSQKLKINESGRTVRLPIPPAASSATAEEPKPTPSPLYSLGIRRSRERFVGRKREMFQAIDALLPTRAGTHRGPEAGDRRVVTLTREGGIGKTALALEVVDWCAERDLFPAGLFVLSCERLGADEEFLSRLLTLFGVAPESQRGDLLALLEMALTQVLPAASPALLFLDNLDDLFGRQVPRETRRKTAEILETVLTAAPQLRILATCRWELGLADHEYELEVPPMSEEESRDVFASHLEDPTHKLEVQETWEQPDSPIRQLVQMSGRHPQSLRLLARQMGRKGLTLGKLRDEARTDLLHVLADPLSSDDEDDRLKKVAVSYELSYRHLSAAGRRLFERLSRLPGGIWCGALAEGVIK